MHFLTTVNFLYSVKSLVGDDFIFPDIAHKSHPILLIYFFKDDEPTFAITKNTSKSILFIGKLARPAYE